MKASSKHVLRIILLILIAVSLMSIFVQSMLPREKSQAESDKVGEIVDEIIPPESPVHKPIKQNLRKIAHFVEFATLGLWTSLYVVFFMPGLKWQLHSLIWGFLSAAVDETIQIFSGRGPAVKDVWIDFVGFLFSALIVYTVWWIAFFIHKKKQTNVDIQAGE